jgi:hypothetical protein
MAITELYVILERANPDDLVQVIDPTTKEEFSRNGLHKILTAPVIHGTFGDVYDAMINPNPDALNPGYNAAEQNLMNLFGGLLRKNDGSEILINPRQNGKVNTNLTYTIDDKFSTALSEIVEPITCQYNGKKVQHKSVDLVVSVSNIGGTRYD